MGVSKYDGLTRKSGGRAVWKPLERTRLYYTPKHVFELSRMKFDQVVNRIAYPLCFKGHKTEVLTLFWRLRSIH